jgi:membrane protease YdiL (CAAX protease family)
LGLAVVILSMLVLFSVPIGYFVAATFVSTSCMLAAAFYLGGLRMPPNLRYPAILFGLGTAVILYFVFFIGGATVNLYHPFGITSASEASIYSLVASPSNPRYLQVVLLLFDSAGYESFFRGVLQNRLQSGVGLWAAPAVALFDACLHVATLNPIWVGGTFITDLLWGLTYYYGKGTQGSFTSHFLWDLAIFIIRPVT